MAGHHLRCSPYSAFQPNADRRFTARLRTFSRTEPIFRSGLSLASHENPSPSSHRQVIAPGLPVPYPTGPSPNLLRSDTPNRLSVLHSPSGVFMPLRILAVSRFSAPEAHLRKMPDSPSLPAAITLKVCWPRINVPGSLLPARPVAQVTRFPALLTTGMPGIEHRNRECRALRLPAPRWLFFASYRINASKRAANNLPIGTGCS